jgi:hypothetical protein
MRSLCLLPLLAVAVAAQTETQWIAFGNGASVRAEGRGMTLQYSPGAKGLSAAAMPAPTGLAALRRIRFRARSDYDTALAFVLNEKQPGGGNYSAVFWSPANRWQTIELSPSDFAVGDGPNDPVDADGKLDLDAVQSIALVDVAAMFAQAPPDAPIVVNRPTGTHTLEIRDFEILPNAAPTPPAGAIDRFDRDFLQWFTPGGMSLKLSAVDNPLHGRALQASYQQIEGQLTVMLRRLTSFDLSKATRLAFDVASEHESTMIVSLETRTGARYTMQVYPPGAREVFHVDLKLSDFEGSGKLDPAQLKSISIVDATASTGGAEGQNTIWIANVWGRP